MVTPNSFSFFLLLSSHYSTHYKIACFPSDYFFFLNCCSPNSTFADAQHTKWRHKWTLADLFTVTCKMLGNISFRSKVKGNWTFVFALGISSMELLLLTLPLINFVKKKNHWIPKNGKQVIPALYISKVYYQDQMKSGISISQNVVL